MVVKNYKTINISGAIVNNSNSFSTSIFLPFVPTHCILKYISIYDFNYANTAGVFLLRTSLLNNEVIFDYASGVEYINSATHIKYKMNPYFLNGNYKFEIVAIDGTLPITIATFNAQIAMMIEFVQEE